MKGQKSAQREEVKTFNLILRANIIRDWSLAIDGGAHVGTWAAEMAPHFASVIAFEPTPESFGYLVENMTAFENVTCRNEALLDETGRVDVLQPSRKRRTLTARFVAKTKRGPIRCVSIDSLGLESCGLIKLDLEGAEPAALEGAARTIRRFKPVLVVEIGGLSSRFDVAPEEVHRQVLGMGYREVFRQTVDRIYAPA